MLISIVIRDISIQSNIYVLCSSTIFMLFNIQANEEQKWLFSRKMKKNFLHFIYNDFATFIFFLLLVPSHLVPQRKNWICSIFFTVRMSSQCIKKLYIMDFKGIVFREREYYYYLVNGLRRVFLLLLGILKDEYSCYVKLRVDNK
jgi:hypothetical protein